MQSEKITALISNMTSLNSILLSYTFLSNLISGLKKLKLGPFISEQYQKYSTLTGGLQRAD